MAKDPRMSRMCTAVSLVHVLRSLPKTIPPTPAPVADRRIGPRKHLPNEGPTVENGSESEEVTDDTMLQAPEGASGVLRGSPLLGWPKLEGENPCND